MGQITMPTLLEGGARIHVDESLVRAIYLLLYSCIMGILWIIREHKVQISERSNIANL